MPVTTIIFDLDGTLLYTLEDLTDSVNYALGQFNYPSVTLDKVRASVGNGVSTLIKCVIPDGESNPDFDECLKIFQEHYLKNMFNKTRPYDGLIPVLESLKKKGYKIAVVSNKFDSAVKALCDNYFDDLIDISAGQRDGIAKKPAPDSVLDVISALGENKEDCIYIGDSDVDIETAHNVGIDCISVVWGYKDIEFLYNHGAHLIVTTPDELLELL